MVANTLWGWLQQWKQTNWHRRDKPIWAAELCQDIAARIENFVVKVRYIDAHTPKVVPLKNTKTMSRWTRLLAIEVAQVDLDWQHKGELFIVWWAHDTSGHLVRDATYKWAHDQGVDLTIDAIAQVIHEYQTCAIIKQAKQLKPFPIDYITLQQTLHGKHRVLIMVEATTGWLETYPVTHATAQNPILGLEKQVLWNLDELEKGAKKTLINFNKGKCSLAPGKELSHASVKAGGQQAGKQLGRE
ncbi:hypothetical protein QYF61_016754 [Mycteria americana]|uniref:Uncharacterized protein n=1 Tax=Mycteria americana TaxID=33587 RepID=A0AAN7NTR8_MYCAM|nr:hypothetical protein QYF61_016754 [Mycteria americana]